MAGWVPQLQAAKGKHTSLKIKSDLDPPGICLASGHLMWSFIKWLNQEGNSVSEQLSPFLGTLGSPDEGWGMCS